mmetsp:Transcript_25041/g.34942  ORF Transcript_25041/g.34942 Transcript_25041/m.34942 type:complete len:122 (-) Transcript_25041:2519-2884(-)
MEKSYCQIPKTHPTYPVTNTDKSRNSNVDHHKPLCTHGKNQRKKRKIHIQRAIRRYLPPSNTERSTRSRKKKIEQKTTNMQMHITDNYCMKNILHHKHESNDICRKFNYKINYKLKLYQQA